MIVVYGHMADPRKNFRKELSIVKSRQFAAVSTKTLRIATCRGESRQISNFYRIISCVIAPLSTMTEKERDVLSGKNSNISDDSRFIHLLVIVSS